MKNTKRINIKMPQILRYAVVVVSGLGHLHCADRDV